LDLLTTFIKIKEVLRTGGSSKKNLKFDYDAFGMRVAKHIFDASNNWEKSTYYVRDLQGNVMATYEETVVTMLTHFKLKERDIYGSSRLGMNTEEVEMIGAIISDTNATHNIGAKYYEMSNYLGNVLAVVSDKPLPVDWNVDGAVDCFKAEIVSTTDYYPFGAPMAGRTLFSSSYRYGFNGMVKDDEISVDGGDYDFGARMYDSRLGRWWSLDALQVEYPSLSPYCFAANNPIFFYDKDGNGIGPGPSKVVNNSSKPITLTGDGNEIRKDGKEDRFRGAVVLNPGDSFVPATKTLSNGTVKKYGIITRKDGTTEETDIYDIDFIDVQPKQLMVFDDGVFSTENIYVDDQASAEYNNGPNDFVPEVDTQENRDQAEKEGKSTTVKFIKNPDKGEIDIDMNGGTITFTDKEITGTAPGHSTIIQITISSGDLETKGN
jgi:RHS repeat-associated protein